MLVINYYFGLFCIFCIDRFDMSIKNHSHMVILILLDLVTGGFAKLKKIPKKWTISLPKKFKIRPGKLVASFFWDFFIFAMPQNLPKLLISICKF